MSFKIKSSLPIMLAVWLLIACNSAPETADFDEPLSAEPTAVPDVDNSEDVPAEENENTAVDDDLATAVYTIIPEESTARFEIDENLRSALTGWHRGSRVTVVGITDQVFGDILLDPTDLGGVTFEDVRINADTLKTDEYFRTRMIQQRILESELYEFIVFEPSEVRGMPDTVEIGEPVNFELEGALTIRDVTLTQTFAVTATLASPTQIDGFASTAVDYASYGLVIPAVPHVSEIEDEVELYIDFVARTP